MAVGKIRLSKAVLVGDKLADEAQTDTYIVAENADFSAGGVLQKFTGSNVVNVNNPIAAGEEITCGYDWWADATTQRSVVATYQGKIMKSVDGGGTYAVTLKSGLTVLQTSHMTEGGSEATGNSRKLFICNGANVVQVLTADAATTHDLTNPPADWAGTNQPTFMFQFRGYMIGAGNANNPHQIYGSLSSDHENFLAAGAWFIPVYPGDALKIVGGITAFGKGWIFKWPYGIYWIDEGSTATPTNWFCRPATRAYGLAPSPHAVTAADDGSVYFISSTGDLIRMTETNNNLSGVDFTNITAKLKQKTLFRSLLSTGMMPRVQLRWYQDKSQLWHTRSDISSGTHQNRIIIHDFSGSAVLTSLVVPQTNADFDYSALWMVRDNSNFMRPWAGSSNGYVNKVGHDNLSTPYVFQDHTGSNANATQLLLKTSYTDFSDQNPDFAVKKLFTKLHVEWEPTLPSGSNNLTTEVFVDGVSKGSVVFDTINSGYASDWASYMVSRGTHDLGGIDGYTIALKLTHTVAQQNIRLLRAWVEFEPLVMSR